jgi:hypothetical protein
MIGLMALCAATASVVFPAWASPIVSSAAIIPTSTIMARETRRIIAPMVLIFLDLFVGI